MNPSASRTPLVVIFALVFYAIMANICFTGGWVIELAVHRIWGEQAESFGPISFTLGLLFSIALTIAPVFLVVGVVDSGWDCKCSA